MRWFLAAFTQRRLLWGIWVALALCIAALTLAPVSAFAVEAGHSHIRGHVTSDGVTPAAKAMVTAYRSDGLGGWTPWSGAYVMKDGTYDIGSLVAGTYRLMFDPDYTDSHLPTKWYSEKPSLATASDVVIGPASVLEGIDANLAPGHIAGRAINGSGTGIPGVTVSAYESDGFGGWTKVGEAVTGANGDYEIGCLRTGAHRLMFETCADYLGIAFGGGDSVWSALAVEVPVTAGMTNSGNNIILLPAGHLAGKVTNDGSTGIKNITVRLYRQDGASLYDCGTRATAADGTYDFGGLVGGTYHVGFDDASGKYPSEYYNDQATIDSASDVTVSTGSISTVNAVLTSARIRGTVTADGVPRQGIEVRVYRMSGDSLLWQCLDNRTAADGTYDIGGLPALLAGETFHVVFLDTDGETNGGTYASEYYLNATTLAGANDVLVAPGETVTGIDGSLSAGTLHGVVTNGSTGIGGVYVSAVNANSHNSAAWGVTAADGTYSFTGLATGSYHLFFDDPSNHYRDEYSGDTTQVALASSLVVTNGAITTYDDVLQELGHITGRVTRDGSTGIAGVRVSAQSPYPGGGYYNYEATTDGNGYYDIFGLETASYRLCFSPPYTSPFGTEWHSDAPDKDSATDITVTAGATASGYDATLAEVGHVTGKVTDGASGISDIRVTAYRPDGAGGWTYASGAYTRADGTYLINNLPQGEYRFGFEDSDAWYEYNGGTFLNEFYADAAAVGSATSVSISNATTTTIDAVLPREARVSGVVRNAAGQALGGISVGLHLAHSADPGRYDTTASDGSYDFGRVPASEYIASFYDPSLIYFTEYFDDFENGAGSTHIPVAAGAVVDGIDATLTAGAHITGRVTSDGSTPMAQVIVYAYRFDQYNKWSPSGVSALTGADGTYDLSPLRPGAYRLMFYDINQVRATEWYDDAFGSGTGTSVNVTDGTTTPGIDAVLGPAGSIEGTVTAQGAGAVSGAWVYARAPDGSGGWDNVGQAATAANGAYRLTGLRPGEYRIEFCGKTPYLGEFYDDVSSISQAATITVVAEQVTRGISAELSPPSAIRGKVTYDGSNGIAGICVRAEKPNGSGGWTLSGYAYSNTDGTYSIPSIDPGIYRVSFDGDATYVGEYYNDTYDAQLAQTLTVLRGVDTLGIDAVLATRGHIAGKVVSDSGAAAPGITVYAYARNQFGNWAYVSETGTDADGLYDLSGLLPDTYRVSFSDPFGTLLAEYFDDATSLTAATDVTVTAGATTGGISATLTAPASISGTVSAGGAGLEGSLVTAWRSDGNGGWDQAGTTYSAASGAYALTMLSAGLYRVEYGGAGGYLGEWFDNAADSSAATTVTVAAGQVVSAVSAELGAPGGISGSVTSSPGVGVAVATVVAYLKDSAGAWGQVACTTTVGTGAYQIDGLRPGEYRVYVMGPTGFASEYYNDKQAWELADTVIVSSGVVTPGVDAVLTALGSISGKATSDGITGIGSVSVWAYSFNGEGWNYVSSASTNESGTYTIANLPAGTYRVQFGATSAYLGEYWDEAASLGTATDIVVLEGQDRSGVDALLDLAGHVTGTVTDGASPLQSIQVTAWRKDGQGGLVWGGNAYTGADGTYDIGGLPGGGYVIHFAGDESHVGEYYQDKLNSIAANEVTVTAGSTTSGVDAALAAPSHIMGTVTSAEGTGLAGVCVWVTLSNGSGGWELLGTATTAANGSYDVGGLPAGLYRVYFRDDSGYYVSEYYQHAYDEALSTSVTVAAGGTATGIDAALHKAGSVAGTVRSESSEPLNGAWMYLLKQNVSGAWESCYYTTTGATGEYLFHGVRPGTYRVSFSHSAYMGEYYADASTVESGTDVVVAEGGYTGGIDATLSTGATISGSVTSSSSAGIAGVYAYAYKSDGKGNWDYAGYAGTDSSGNYTITGLSAGIYRVQMYAFGTGYASEWYDDARSLGGATSITLIKDEKRTGVNAVLAPNGYITGRVTSEASTGLAGIYVTLYAQNEVGEWQEAGNCYTDANGAYRTPGLVAGVHRVSFLDESGTYAPEYYDDQTNFDSSTGVTVTAGADTTSIDATLGTAGHITGTVTDELGFAVSNVIAIAVTANPDGSLVFGPSAFTGTDGGFHISGLAPGTYRVLYFDSSGFYAYQFYDASATYASAAGVGVTAGSTAAGVNATMTAAGRITGTVTAGGAPHPNTTVVVYVPNGLGGWTALTSSYTQPDGTYAIGGLATGSYRLEFIDDTGVEPKCYIGGAPSLSGSADVTVTGGATRSGVDAEYHAEPPNRAPVAVPDVKMTTEDATLSVEASGTLANDVDPDGDSLTAVLASSTVHGVVDLRSDGSFTYRPQLNWNGTDEFTYRAFDGVASSEITTVTIVVEPVNDAPAVHDDIATASENQTLSVGPPGLLGNDSDVENDPLTGSLVTQAAHGVAVVHPDGSYTYRPNTDYDGPDSFTYRAFDGRGYSAPATVTITVQNAPLIPTTSTRTSLAAKTVNIGCGYSFTGTLTTSGTPVGSRRVVLESSSDGTSFVATSLTATTTASGAFTFPVYPVAKTWYRVVFAGDSKYSGSVTTAACVSVVAWVSNPVAPATMYTTKYSTVYGTLKPRHVAPVRIYKYRYVGGRYVAAGYVSAKVINSTSYSKYSVSLKLPYAGKWRLRAYAPADAGHLAAWSSGYDYVTVK